jgi:hypothetical protein
MQVTSILHAGQPLVMPEAKWWCTEEEGVEQQRVSKPCGTRALLKLRTMLRPHRLLKPLQCQQQHFTVRWHALPVTTDPEPPWAHTAALAAESAQARCMERKVMSKHAHDLKGGQQAMNRHAHDQQGGLMPKRRRRRGRRGKGKKVKGHPQNCL